MLNFREFDAGPDPFGRKFHVWFKWLQTAISLRHADTVDVKFVILDEDGTKAEKTIALPHADLIQVSKEVSRRMDDGWCARIAASHLLYIISMGDDMEKNLVTMQPSEMRRYAGEIAAAERAELQNA